MVAIDGARVRAAIEWKGMSVNGAAGRIDVSQQTLDSIVRGKTKRCYKGLRESLAGLLDLPAGWLGGETDLLPSLTSWLPYPELGYQPPLWVDENMRIIRPPAKGGLPQRTTLPPRYQLAAHEICQQEGWKLELAGFDETHTHLVLSWTGYFRWEEADRRLKNLLVLKLNRRHNTPGKRWFVRRHSAPRRVEDRKHFNRLRDVYLPDHRGLFWSRGMPLPHIC